MKTIVKNITKHNMMILVVLCMYTTNAISGIKPTFNNVSVYRIQLKVITNSIEHAETDSPVWVQLNKNDYRYFLNLSKDDREKGKTDVYEILSPSINKIGDIQMIKLGICGEDGWNFRSIELLINGKTIYKNHFGSKGQWIDMDNKKHPKSYTVITSKLRRHTNWNYTFLTKGIENPPMSIPVTVIKSTIESAVGNTISGMEKVVWGKRQGKDYVSIKRVSSNRLRVDLDLKAKVKLMPDAAVDVDFDLVFNCIGGVIKTEIDNFSAVAKGYEVELGPLTVSLQSLMLFECLLPGTTGRCYTGLSMIVKGFDFTINYGGSTSSCSAAMRLDHRGNLHLNRIPPNRGNTASLDKLKTTMVVSGFHNKR